MGTNCAPLIADLFLFCYEREFKMPLSADKDAEIIEATCVIPILTVWSNTFTHQNFN